jgi:arylsulfatase A-like enzyme
MPWYAPQRYFDLHPLDKLVMPVVKENDLDDVPRAALSLVTGRKKEYERIVAAGQYRQAVQAYLACMSLLDDCISRLLDGLDKSPERDNTIVVLWSDNGYQLGEKQCWQKHTLWEEATHVPLVIVAPGVTKPGGRCDTSVDLMCLYPTLAELCGLPVPEDLEGTSVVPLLRDPKTRWRQPALMTWKWGSQVHHAVRLANWRYIRYADGSEELYDHARDPHEWKNLAGDAQYEPVKRRLAGFMPTKNAEEVRAN